MWMYATYLRVHEKRSDKACGAFIGLDLSGEALAIKDVTAQIRHPDLFSQGSDGPKEGHGDSESFVGVCIWLASFWLLVS